MARVHPLVYVGAGAVVSIVSLGLGDEFKLFFYVGAMALVFGGVSALIGGMQHYNSQKKEEKTPQKAQQGAMFNHPQHRGHTRMHLKYCNRCGMQAHMHANFCQRCGMRV